MGNFTFIRTDINDLIIIEPKVFGDERGYFMESYHKKDFAEGGIDQEFVQDNLSSSKKGVLRGMHFQINQPQGKLVKVLSGEVFDVAVDIRKNSTTFGCWYGIYLSKENRRMMYVPEGFAHGFLVMSDSAEFSYKCTRFYNPQDEGGFRFDDKQIAIEWPFSKLQPIVSEKDRALKSFEDISKELKLI
jgi:dTDP-4-dehydrorhamnose 3,5-epimerase